MPAVYPVAVKTFTTRVDAVDTVYAAHINDLQSEVNAVETALGAAPATWEGWSPPSQPGAYQPHYVIRDGGPASTAPPIATAKTYTSVTERLDVMQQQLAWLTWMQTTNNNLKAIWAPVASVRCPGYTVAANQTAPLVWSSTDYDPYQIFQGGSVLNCPLDGWWDVTCSVWATPAAAAGVTHVVYASLFIGGVEYATDGSQLPPNSGQDKHRISLGWAGPWHIGQPLEIRFRNVNGSTSSTVQAVVSVAYSRDIK
jgi:hypothetical protein